MAVLGLVAWACLAILPKLWSFLLRRLREGGEPSGQLGNPSPRADQPMSCGTPTDLGRPSSVLDRRLDDKCQALLAFIVNVMRHSASLMQILISASELVIA